MCRATVFASLFALTVATAIQAAAPQLINYQGFLRDNVPPKNPVNGTFDITFTIYDNLTGGSIIWTETQIGVVVDVGNFSVLLGSVTTLVDTVFKDTTRYLGVKIGADPELAPRGRLVTTPYAFRSAGSETANNADLLDSLNSTDFATAGHTHPTSGNGWVDDGTVVRLETSTDSVGIGTATPTAMLDVIGDVVISGKATIGQGHTNTGLNAFVAGEDNTASHNQATVSGGIGNAATGEHSTVGGGIFDTASGLNSTVGGGGTNLASGSRSTVGGGGTNTASGNFSTVGGGKLNSVTSHWSTIAGGSGNSIISQLSTIGGGFENFTSNIYATVSGGHNNSVTEAWATISGGGDNIASQQAAVVGGGRHNRATGIGSVVAGGGSVITAADSNSASGNYSTVSGGIANRASGRRTTISGGGANLSAGNTASVGGGENNTASGDYSVVSGGQFNVSSGERSVIGGGESDTANAPYSGVASGYSNLAGDEITDTGAFVGGGYDNSATNKYSTVSGGRYNMASGAYSVVAGGGGNIPLFSNTASGDNSTVGGGGRNTASGGTSTVGGGGGNTASGGNATVGGGGVNIASGQLSTVGGGGLNRASGITATVSGGHQNLAAGDYSFAAGRRAKANHDGAFVWADESNADFVSSAINQFNVRASGGTRIYSNSALSAGVTMAAGASSWSAVSDSALKRNIREVDYEEVLEKVAALPISQWSYEAQDETIEHIGPMAQDFYRLFGLGEDDKHINTLDPDGVALAAIKALYEKSKRIDALEARLEKLEKLLEEQNKK